ncbi:MAG: diacylglycerol kinase [Patescibacteria group bacterium]|nr:diacylglycerol kinase [Patescibacteria group bacterium]
MIISIKKLGKSFKVAFSGLKIAIREENTIRAGIFISVVMFFLMFYFPLLPIERVMVVFCIFLVLSLELMNTQVERVTDLIDLNHNPKIRAIKDLAAAAVLMSIIGAAIVACFIFLPYFN